MNNSPYVHRCVLRTQPPNHYTALGCHHRHGDGRREGEHMGEQAHASEAIRARIEHIYPSLRPAERAVAQYLHDHADAAALTVHQLAQATHSSEPTVIRLSRKLGFSGYRELRYVLRHPAAEHHPPFDPLEGFDLNPWDQLEDIPGKAVGGARSMLDDLLASLDRPSLRKAVGMLATAGLIDIIGVENSIVPATDLCTKLSYLGLHCRIATDAYLQQINAGHLTDQDVAIAFSYSGSSRDTIKALQLAKSQGAHTIAVTNASNAPIRNWADITLLAGSGERTIYGNAIFSRISHIALVDMLYMGVILSDYGRFAARLDRSGRYIQDRGFTA